MLVASCGRLWSKILDSLDSFDILISQEWLSSVYALGRSSGIFLKQSDRKLVSSALMPSGSTIAPASLTILIIAENWFNLKLGVRPLVIRKQCSLNSRCRRQLWSTAAFLWLRVPSSRECPRMRCCCCCLAHRRPVWSLRQSPRPSPLPPVSSRYLPLLCLCESHPTHVGTQVREAPALYTPQQWFLKRTHRASWWDLQDYPTQRIPTRLQVSALFRLCRCTLLCWHDSVF